MLSFGIQQSYSANSWINSPTIVPATQTSYDATGLTAKSILFVRVAAISLVRSESLLICADGSCLIAQMGQGAWSAVQLFVSDGVPSAPQFAQLNIDAAANKLEARWLPIQPLYLPLWAYRLQLAFAATPQRPLVSIVTMCDL